MSSKQEQGECKACMGVCVRKVGVRAGVSERAGRQVVRALWLCGKTRRWAETSTQAQARGEIVWYATWRRGTTGARGGRKGRPLARVSWREGPGRLYRPGGNGMEKAKWREWVTGISARKERARAPGVSPVEYLTLDRSCPGCSPGFALVLFFVAPSLSSRLTIAKAAVR